MFYVIMSPYGELFHILESDGVKIKELAEEFLKIHVSVLRHAYPDKEKDELLVEYLKSHKVKEVGYETIIYRS